MSLTRIRSAANRDFGLFPRQAVPRPRSMGHDVARGFAAETPHTERSHPHSTNRLRASRLVRTCAIVRSLCCARPVAKQPGTQCHGRAGFVLVTLYMGPLGLLLYVLADKEPRPGAHEEFIKPLWKQG